MEGWASPSLLQCAFSQAWWLPKEVGHPPFSRRTNTFRIHIIRTAPPTSTPKTSITIIVSITIISVPNDCRRMDDSIHGWITFVSSFRTKQWEFGCFSCEQGHTHTHKYTSPKHIFYIIISRTIESTQILEVFSILCWRCSIPNSSFPQAPFTHWWWSS